MIKPMQIAVHMGAHATDQNRLVKSLLKNRAALSERGVNVPGTLRYRRFLRNTMIKLVTTPPDADTRTILLDSIMDEDDVDRLVISDDCLICAPPRIFEQHTLYNMANRRARVLRKVFGQDRLEFFFAIRNPATFVQAAYRGSAGLSYEDFFGNTDPRSLSWARMIEDMMGGVGDATLTVWCNEDTPLLWPEVMREVAGVSPETKLAGEEDLISELVTEEGLQRFLAFKSKRDISNPLNYRRAAAALLTQFPLPDAFDQEINLPGWTDDVVGEMTEAYDSDLQRIGNLPNVRLMLP